MKSVLSLRSTKAVKGNMNCPICGASDSKAMVMDATFFDCGSKWSTRGQSFIKIECDIPIQLTSNQSKIVNVNKLRRVKAYLKSINEQELQDIIWVEDGKRLDIPKEYIDEFKYVGLNNTEFIMCGCYKEGIKIEEQ